MRIKRGVTKRQGKKKILKLAKGYRMSYSKIYKRAKEAVLHAGQYSYAHRRRRPSQMRTEWIKVISAALSTTQFSYSKFMNALKMKSVMIDKKNIAELVVHQPEAFKKLVEVVEN